METVQNSPHVQARRCFHWNKWESLTVVGAVALTIIGLVLSAYPPYHAASYACLGGGGFFIVGEVVYRIYSFCKPPPAPPPSPPDPSKEKEYVTIPSDRKSRPDVVKDDFVLIR